MQITLTLNGIRVSEEIAPDMLLIDFVRAHGCKSVKRGCETSNCGLCTVCLWTISRCCPAPCWQPAPMGTRSLRWRACRKRLPSLVPLLQIRVQNSVVSATRALL